MDMPFVRENARERTRLRALVSSVTDDQLRMTLPNGWPIYVLLAHLAFWDRRSTVLMNKWSREGICPSPVDMHIINDALAPLFAEMSPRKAANLAVSCAEVIDAQLEQASDDLVAGLIALGDRFRLYRSDHRKMHLDAIESLLKE